MDLWKKARLWAADQQVCQGALPSVPSHFGKPTNQLSIAFSTHQIFTNASLCYRRNVYRGTPKMFILDQDALSLAKSLVVRP